MYHNQRILKRKDISTVSWIPSKLAIKGNFVGLKKDEKWIKGW